MHSYRLHRDLQTEEIKWTMIEGDELENVKDFEKEAKPLVKADAIVYCALCQHHVRDAQSLASIQKHLAETWVFSNFDNTYILTLPTVMGFP
jgi:hypothetical protein